MAKETMLLAAVGLWLMVTAVMAAEEPNAKILVTRAARVVDLRSQVVNQTVDISLLNEGETSAGHFLYTIDGMLAPHTAYIRAQVGVD